MAKPIVLASKSSSGAYNFIRENKVVRVAGGKTYLVADRWHTDPLGSSCYRSWVYEIPEEAVEAAIRDVRGDDVLFNEGYEDGEKESVSFCVDGEFVHAFAVSSPEKNNYRAVKMA